MNKPTPTSEGRPHPDFDGHAERPFAAWSASEKWQWAAGLNRLRSRVEIRQPSEIQSLPKQPGTVQEPKHE